jgi:phosphatidylinositol glycan class A protein
LNICIVSDFFLPRLGGVELHQYSLAQALINLGHKVIIVTGSYGDKNQRQGLRYLTSGLKVYYLPQIALHNQVSAPTLFTLFPLFRTIVLREEIDIIHGHQTTSPLAHQCIMYGKVLNIPTLFTDHSMFGIATPSSIHVNKLGKFTLTGIDQVIAVSHTLRENIVVRTGISPKLVSVVPNALDHTKFKPDPRCYCQPEFCPKDSDHVEPQLPPVLPQIDLMGNPKCSKCLLQRAPHSKDSPTFVVLSRLVYRKGIEFVVYAIPLICHAYPNVRFVIGGGGPHGDRIREMLQLEKLTHRVLLLGEVPHHRVRDVLQMGHIFINTSLTETFCIAILEAICTGLHIVATRVGGVPEVLPHKLIKYCDPNHYDVYRAMVEALNDLTSPTSMDDYLATQPVSTKSIQSSNIPSSIKPHSSSAFNHRNLPRGGGSISALFADSDHDHDHDDHDDDSDSQPSDGETITLAQILHRSGHSACPSPSTPSLHGNSNDTFEPFILHELTAPFYSWHNVAKRTVDVYNYTLTQKYLQQEGLGAGCEDVVNVEFNHEIRQKHKYNHLWYLIRLYWEEHGHVSSLLFIFVILFCGFISTCCDVISPIQKIEIAQEFHRDGNSIGVNKETSIDDHDYDDDDDDHGNQPDVYLVPKNRHLFPLSDSNSSTHIEPTHQPPSIQQIIDNKGKFDFFVSRLHQDSDRWG